MKLDTAKHSLVCLRDTLVNPINLHCPKCNCNIKNTYRFCPKCGVYLNGVSSKFRLSETKKQPRSPFIDPKIEEEVDAKVVALIGEGGYLGYCHRFWSAKQSILREEYGIEWQTPAEQHPEINFD